MRRATVIVGLTATACGLLVATPAAAEPGVVPPRFVSGWLPYWSTASSVASFTQNRGVMSDASPFWHTLQQQADGAIVVADQATPTNRTTVINAVRAAGVPLIPAVTDGLGQLVLANELSTPAGRSRHANLLLGLVLGRGYDGIDLDYEGFAFRDDRSTWPTTRANWTAFIAELAGALHTYGRQLSITVPAGYSTSADSAGYTVYNWSGIAPYADRFRVMAYDYSFGSPGPIGPIEWVDRVAQRAVAQLPAGRVFLGVATYGRDWLVETSGTCPSGAAAPPARSGLTAQQASALAAQAGVAPTWAGREAERTFTYSRWYTGADGNCAARRVVWYLDGLSVAVRANLVARYGLGGIALWTIGGEDPSQWGYLWQLAGLSTSPYDPRVASEQEVANFVSDLYEVFLARGSDPGGLDFWVRALRAGSYSRQHAARWFASSPEYSAAYVSRAWQQVLGHAPDAAGLSHWSAALTSGRVDEAGILVALLSSEEFYNAIGRNDAVWVSEMYRRIMGREVDAGGLGYWQQVAASSGRINAAMGVVQSGESAGMRVQKLYLSVLRRDADLGGVAYWSQVIVFQGDVVLAGILAGSDEFFVRSQS